MKKYQGMTREEAQELLRVAEYPGMTFEIHGDHPDVDGWVLTAIDGGARRAFPTASDWFKMRARLCKLQSSPDAL